MLALLEGRALRVAAGLALAAAAALAVLHCGASASDAASGFAPNGDGGSNGDGATGSDGGVADASFDGGGEEPVVLVMHASPDLYDFRVCFGLTEAADGGLDTKVGAPFPDDAYGPMADSSYPGVPVGGGAPLRQLPGSGGYLVPYVIRADRLINSTKTCAEALCTTGAGCLQAHFDYERLAPIARSSFSSFGRSVLAVAGCALGSANGCATAGPLRAEVLRLGPGAYSPGAIEAQFVNLAPVVGSANVNVDGVAAAYTLPTFASVAPPVGVALAAPPPGDLAAYASEALHVSWGDAGAHADFSLALVAHLSNPSVLPPAFFEQRADFVFAVVGDPNAAPPTIDGGTNPSFDGRGLHVVALPLKAADPIDGGR